MVLSFLLVIFSVSSADNVITEVNLNPVDDTYVDSDGPNSNFGSSSYLYVEFSHYEYLQDEYRNSILKFDVSTVPAEVNIVYASLELYCWFSYETPEVGAHYCVDDSWNEDTITWNNAPSFASEPTDVVQVNADDQWYSWDITSDAKSSLEDGILTVVLRIENVEGISDASFYSKDSWRDHPKLVIGYTTQILCSVSPSVVTLGSPVTVTGNIPIPAYDTVQLTYTKPDMSDLVRIVPTDSDGSFIDTYNPDIVGIWGITAAWDGAESYNASSSTDMFMVTENERDNWAIIIGVKDYREMKNLRYTDNDAIELHNKLKEVWPEDHLKLLINEQANKSAIESAIKDWLAPKETAESVVLFFFSGHGGQGPDQTPFDETDGKDEYICPYDSLKYSYDNDICDDTLDSWLDSLDSQHISVFLDSCNSGGFIDKVSGKELLRSDLGDDFAKDLSREGRVIITACNETESSWGYGDLDHGLFTYYILEGLDSLELVDDNGDNEISAEEIFDYVEPLVKVYAEGKHHPQHPQMYDGYEGKLTLITTVTVNFDSNPLKTSIIINEVSYTTPLSFVWPLYTEHTFHVSKQVWPEYGGTRYLFTSWSDGNNLTSRTIIVSEFMLTNYTANYQTQHYLVVSSEYGNPQGEGWYNNGSTAIFSISSSVDHGNGTRDVFMEWFGDVSSTDSSFTVVMDAPKQVYVQWKTQYYLTVSSDYGDPQGEGWYDIGTTASFEVAPLVDFGNGTRVIFTEWFGNTSSTSSSSSIVMDALKQVSAQWKRQHHLNIEVDPLGIVFLNGEGWYDEDSSVQTESVPSIVGGGEGMRYLLETWKVDEVAEDGESVSVFMNSPHSAVACYNVQYYLTIISQYGQPEGEGWYDADSVAAFSVEPPQGFIIQKNFVGWSGDSTSDSASATIVMDDMKTVIANWSDEYTQLYIVLAVVALIMVFIVAVKKLV